MVMRNKGLFFFLLTPTSSCEARSSGMSLVLTNRMEENGTGQIERTFFSLDLRDPVFDRVQGFLLRA